MAAHVVTALMQIMKGETSPAHVIAATNGASWAGQLDTEDWHWFNDGRGHDECENAHYAESILPKYEEEWRDLGCPSNYENWVKAIRAQDEAETIDKAVGMGDCVTLEDR